MSDERNIIHQPLRINHWKIDDDVDLKKADSLTEAQGKISRDTGPYHETISETLKRNDKKKMICSKCNKSMDECKCSKLEKATYDWSRGETSGKMSRQFAEDVLSAPHMYDEKTVSSAKAYQSKKGTLSVPIKTQLKKSVDTLIDMIEKREKIPPEKWNPKHVHTAKREFTDTKTGEKINPGDKYGRFAWPKSEVKRVKINKSSEEVEKAIPGAAIGGLAGGALAGPIGAGLGAAGGTAIEDTINEKKKKEAMKKAYSSVQKAIADIENEISKSQKIEKIAPALAAGLVGAAGGFAGAKLLDKNKKMAKEYTDDEISKAVEVIEDIINNLDESDPVRKQWDDMVKGFPAAVGALGAAGGGHAKVGELNLGGPLGPKVKNVDVGVGEKKEDTVHKAVAEPADSIKPRTGDGQIGVNNPTTANTADLEKKVSNTNTN